MKEILLTQGKIAFVDDRDFEYLSQFSWYANFNGYNWYATRKENRKTIYMHRVIMKLHNPGFKGHIDHVDMNGFNNQYSNIRIATRSQNGANRRLQINNTSGYMGVSWNKQRQKMASSNSI